MSSRIAHIILLVLITAIGTHAQTAKLTASAPAEVGVGENFRISWELNASGSDFVAPEITDFQVLGGPNQSTSMQFINGSMSQSISFSYIVRGAKEGTFEIGPARVKAGGQVIQSNALTIKVRKGAAASAQQQQQQSGQQGQQQKASGPSADDTFAKVEVSRTNVMVGDVITAKLKVYTRSNIVGFDNWELPSFDGFFNKPLDQGNQIQMDQEVLNGVTYQVGVIKTYVLYPQKSGQIEIGPLSMKAIVREQVQNRRRSFWDPFGAAYQDFELPLKSKPVMITVNPLPAGKPADFSGLTGDFKLTAKMDKAMVKSNEAVNLTVTISGEGNLFQVKAPNITFPPDIEAYDPKVTDNIKLTAGGVSGSKTFEYVLIPRYAGDFEIGPFEFSYFDSKSKTFKTSSQDAFQLVVEKGKGEEEGPRPSVALGSKEDIRLIGSDIRYIKQGQYELREQGGHFYRSGLFFGLLAVPALLFVALMGYAAYMQKMGADVAGMKSRGATKLAKKRLEKAKKLLAENQSTAFYEEVFKALTEYVAFRHHISVSELSKGKIRETLTAKGIAATSIDGFIAVLDKAEFARFAPGADKQMGSIYEEALGAIVNVEEGKG
jgi:hypothetical protein